MKLTSKGRYAVMAMADLAKNYIKEPTSLTEISLRQGISIDYLEQIFSKLKKNILITTEWQFASTLNKINTSLFSFSIILLVMIIIFKKISGISRLLSDNLIFSNLDYFSRNI